MIPRSIFVTGSGTGVGKTYVSKLLLQEYSELGYRATYMKPVETGCEESADGKVLPGPDAYGALGFASCKADGPALHSPYRYAQACSPHLAAANAGQRISVTHILSVYEDLKKATSADIIVVEGAGGVLVPINESNQYIADVIKALAIPAVLVVTPDLGTLNHTFMSLQTLEQYKVPVAGVIVNNARNIERDYIYEDNVKTIREHITPVPCIEVPYNEMANDWPISNRPLFSELYNEIADRC